MRGERSGRVLIAAGALAAALAVALGAAASHGLRAHLAVNDPAGWFATALAYQQWHALALVVVGLAAVRMPSRWFVVAGWLMVAGLLLFCGSLFLRSLAGVHELRALTPWGGGAFIAGWLCVAVGAASAGRPRT